MKLGGKVTPDRLQITAGQDIAFTSNLEVRENFDKDGKPQKVAIRATNLFRKEAGQWKMIGHHTDLLPYLKKTASRALSRSLLKFEPAAAAGRDTMRPPGHGQCER